MKEEIAKFLDSPDALELHLDFTPVSQIEIALSELGFILDDSKDYETNGWTIDFWYFFKHLERGVITLSGSLFYGNFKLAKQTPEEAIEEALERIANEEKEAEFTEKFIDLVNRTDELLARIKSNN